MRALILSLLLLLPLAACGDAGPEADAAVAARVFYDITVSEKQGGVPDEDLRSRLRPVISPGLDRLLAQAAEAESRHTARVNNSEPPYLQGDIFSSLFEGPTAYEIGTCEGRERVVQCEVLLAHEAEEPVQWTDRVLLVREGDRWLVDDIMYGGGWDFAPKGTLQAMLKSVAAQEE